MIDTEILHQASTDGEIRAAAALGAAAAKHHVLDPHRPTAFVLPEGYEAGVVAPDLDRWDPLHPRMKKGNVEPATLDAFILYARRHWTIATTVWVHPTNGTVIAVIDDHEATDQAPPIIVVDDDGNASETEPGRVEGDDGRVSDTGAPGHGQHRATLKLLKTPEWLFWRAADGKSFNQETFAEHIEDGLREIRDPDPSVMLDIANTFTARSDMTFKATTNLQSGAAQLQYNEGVQATAGAGELEVPREIKLAVAPFLGGPAYEVTARFRYRVRAGKLTLTYRLDRPDAIERDALTGVSERLAQAFPGAVFIGTPRG